MFSIECFVVRQKHVTYSKQAPKGSGRCKDSYEEQTLYRLFKWNDTVLLKLPVLVSPERVPNDVIIDIGCFGAYTGPWRSKFAAIIDIEDKRNLRHFKC